MKSYTETLTNITAVFIVILITVFLFCFGSAGYETITTVKRHFFYAICGGYCAVIISLTGYYLIKKRCSVIELKHLFTNTFLAQWFAVLYLLCSLIATLLSPYRQYAWIGASRGEGFITIAIYCLSFIFVTQYAEIKKWMIYLFGISCVLLSCICLLQLKSINILSLYPTGYSYWDGDIAYSGKYIGTIGNIDHFASLLSLTIPILWCAIIKMRDNKRFLLFIPLVLLLYILVRIDVAAGLLAVFVGFFFCIPIILAVPKKTRLIIIFLLILLIALCLFFVYSHDFSNDTLHEAHELLNGRWDSSFGSGRVYIWSSVMEKASNRFFFGYGPDTMILTGIEPFQRYDETIGKTIISLIDTAHNEYLNVLFHQGVFALFAFLCIIAISLTGWVKKAPTSVPAAICGCGVLCYCIQAFFGISQVITSPFFWVLLALLVKSCNIRMASVL